MSKRKPSTLHQSQEHDSQESNQPLWNNVFAPGKEPPNIEEIKKAVQQSMATSSKPGNEALDLGLEENVASFRSKHNFPSTISSTPKALSC